MVGIQTGIMLEKVMSALLLAAALGFLLQQEKVIEEQYRITAERILQEPVLIAEDHNAGI